MDKVRCLTVAWRGKLVTNLRDCNTTPELLPNSHCHTLSCRCCRRVWPWPGRSLFGKYHTAPRDVRARLSQRLHGKLGWSLFGSGTRFLFTRNGRERIAERFSCLPTVLHHTTCSHRRASIACIHHTIFSRYLPRQPLTLFISSSAPIDLVASMLEQVCRN